jgi:hypothetical protein
MKVKNPQAVKYFIGALFSDKDRLENAKQVWVNRIGEIDMESKSFPFDVTDYYEAEMGTPIFRQFFSFASLMSPGKLADLKLICNDIEEQFAVDNHRKVNLDIGYLDFHKMVLASAKYNGHKVYLSEGVYADVTLVFERGEFHSLEHTFPDFKSGQYDEVFMRFRNTYKSQLKVMQ